jgi:hypothetical protein
MESFKNGKSYSLPLSRDNEPKAVPEVNQTVMDWLATSLYPSTRPFLNDHGNIHSCTELLTLPNTRIHPHGKTTQTKMTLID